MRKFIAICILLLTAGCSLLQPPPDLDWDHDPEAIIIRVTMGGGMQPEVAYYNNIPLALVWGDGRIVWQTHNADYNRQVWQGQLSEEDMTALLQTFADKGFFRMDAYYEPKDTVYDSNSTSLRLNLLSDSYSVSEYHSGAPPKFHELVDLLTSGAGTEATPYIPQSVHLTAVLLTPREGMNTDDFPTWDAAALELDLDDATGIWVEGAALARAWEIVNQREWSPQVAQGDDLYELYVQLPQLTGQEPR